MDKSLNKSLTENIKLFQNEKQSLIYTTLLHNGELGAAQLFNFTGIHRETIQRELKKMEEVGTIIFIKTGRNKKAKAIDVLTLQSILEKQRDNFDLLLKPLLTAEAKSKNRAITQVYMGDAAFGLLQLKLMKLQPNKQPINVISALPKEWINAMIESKKLTQFENIRLNKDVGINLLCFEGNRGEVERNNREYFASQPEKLKRKYQYVQSELDSPLAIQIWYNQVVINIFNSSPMINIVIKDENVVKAMQAYYKVLSNIAK